MPQFSKTKETPFWMVPDYITKRYDQKELAPKADVVVVGSGYTGVVTALQLRKAGVDVTLVEKEKIGSEASGKNGGMALTGLKVDLYGILKKYGKEKLQQFFQEALSSLDFVENLINEGKIDCDFQKNGVLNAAFKSSHFEKLKKKQEFLATYLDHKTQLIPPEEMHSEIGSDLYHGGLVELSGAGLHPRKYIAGLIRMADEAGVSLHENVAAQRIERANGKMKVYTSQGTIQADRVVVGTNGYTTNLTPWQMRRVVPVESFMIATEELPDHIAEPLVPHKRMIFDSKRFLFYFRRSPDGKRMLFGGRPKQSGRSTLEKARILRQDMLSVYPQLEKFAIDYCWYGKVCFTVNRFPIIGERDGIVYAMGYCGTGVAMATYFGYKLADQILGKGLDSIFATLPSIPIPFYSGNPWFLPIAHNYFKFLDLVK